jgi:cytoskeletal protein CcmA (bactofilin family)
MPTQSSALLSRGVSIKGSVKFLNELLIDGEVEGTIDSTGTLTIGEHARIRGEIRAKSVNVRGTVEGNIFVTERCELQAGCTLHGDIEAPRLMVDENVTFRGNAKVGTGKQLPAWRLLWGLCFSPGHMDAVIPVNDEAGNVIETHEHAGEFKQPWAFFAKQKAATLGEAWRLIAICAFYLADSAGEHNLSGISPHPGQVASWLWRTDVTLSRYVCIHAGEIASPLSAYKTQSFVAGHSVAYAFVR